MSPDRKRRLQELLKERKNRDARFVWGLVYTYYNNAQLGTFRGTKEIAAYSTREVASRKRKDLIGKRKEFTTENLRLKRRFVQFGEGNYL